jgi:hypothetical protein
VIELLLLEHDEADKPLQFVPLILIAAGVAAIIWHLVRPGPATLNTLAVVMVLYVLSSFVGFLAHFYGSAEFVLDLNPDAGTLEILEKALHAKATPLLAPGMMMQLGLLGLAQRSLGSQVSIRHRAHHLPSAATGKSTHYMRRQASCQREVRCDNHVDVRVVHRRPPPSAPRRWSKPASLQSGRGCWRRPRTGMKRSDG